MRNLYYPVHRLYVAICYLLFAISPVSAQGVDVSQIGGGQVSTFPQYVGVLYAWGARLGISLAIIMTIYSGYLYMTSSGNPESTKTAKEYLTGAIVGLALIFLSYLILNTISPNLV